ncbi:MAG: hypothetical protein ACE5ES_02615 [Candidatus Nanoarchaeia archaeon]
MTVIGKPYSDHGAILITNREEGHKIMMYPPDSSLTIYLSDPTERHNNNYLEEEIPYIPKDLSEDKRSNFILAAVNIARYPDRTGSQHFLKQLMLGGKRLSSYDFEVFWNGFRVCCGVDAEEDKDRPKIWCGLVHRSLRNSYYKHDPSNSGRAEYVENGRLLRPGHKDFEKKTERTPQEALLETMLGGVNLLGGVNHMGIVGRAVPSDIYGLLMNTFEYIFIRAKSGQNIGSVDFSAKTLLGKSPEQVAGIMKVLERSKDTFKEYEIPCLWDLRENSVS